MKESTAPESTKDMAIRGGIPGQMMWIGRTNLERVAIETEEGGNSVGEGEIEKRELPSIGLPSASQLYINISVKEQRTI
jgi:hypothetical protein